MRRKAEKWLLQEQREHLRKQLCYTTHKLEILETNFDATKQYLETELRAALEKLEKFTDKLQRILSSYSTLQRINQELEEKFNEKTQQYEEEKTTLGREIIILKNLLKEAKITIKKLREHNDLYKKDCTSAAQLLQCGKSLYIAQTQFKLPNEFEEKARSHMENHEHGARSKGLCHSPYSNSASSAASLVEKFEAGFSCPVTRSPNPQPQDPDVLANKINSVDMLQNQFVYKSSDLYCSDTALYCPMDQRGHDHWQRRRKSMDLQDRNTCILHTRTYTNHNSQLPYNNVALNEGFTRVSSSYSSFSNASDEKGLGPSSTISSSHLALYMDWQDGDYEFTSTSSFDNESPRFPKSHSFQHSPQQGNSPVYTRTAFCYSKAHYSPRLTCSHRVSSSGVPKQNCSSIHIPQEELFGHLRHLSVEDINSFLYLNPGRVSPYSFSEQHFGPSKIKQGSINSGVQTGNHTGMPDSYFYTSPGSNWAPSPNHRLNLCKPEKGPVYQSNNSIPESKSSLFLAGILKDNENTMGNLNKQYEDVSPNSSAESRHQSQMDTSNVQQYKLQRQDPQITTFPQHQNFSSTGLHRKDSLTKAQLYGTLLN